MAPATRPSAVTINCLAIARQLYYNNFAIIIFYNLNTFLTFIHIRSLKIAARVIRLCITQIRI